MRIKFFLIIFFVAFAFAACSDNKETIFTYEPRIVVDGRIENDDYARVTLTYSASLNQNSSQEAPDIIIRDARVTVSDGERSEVLEFHYNDQIFPPYEYRSSALKGEVGKTYYLTVEVGDKVLTSETFIPEPVELEDMWFREVEANPSIGYIFVSFYNTSPDSYLVWTKVKGKETFFTPTLYGSFDSAVYDRDVLKDMQLNKGPTLFPELKYDTFFKKNNTVYVKFSTQSISSHRFWQSYQNELINSLNPIFPATSNLRSNIDGGIGIWSGYGSIVYEIAI